MFSFLFLYSILSLRAVFFEDGEETGRAYLKRVRSGYKKSLSVSALLRRVSVRLKAKGGVRSKGEKGYGASFNLCRSLRNALWLDFGGCRTVTFGCSEMKLGP